MDWNVYLAKAREAHKIAEYCLGEGAYNSCANRAYYAAFLVAVAGLIKLTDFRPSRGEWGHGLVQAQVNTLLIKRRKVLPSGHSDTLADLIVVRTTADYEAKDVSKRQAERVLRKTTDFLSNLEEAIETSDGSSY
jgi:uncharacterized protein (UPF0332 family)